MVSCLIKAFEKSTNATSRSTLNAETEQNYVRRNETKRNFFQHKFIVSFIRIHVEPAKGKNDYCPRKNGFFAHPDPTVCDAFYTCVDGDYIENKCTGGLHFDEYTGTCVWPETAGREGCVEQRKEVDGFQCPKDKKKNDDSGQIIAHPHFPHPEDCQKFYVCLNGVEPRELGCTTGEVFNDETKRCDAPENVPGW